MEVVEDENHEEHNDQDNESDFYEPSIADPSLVNPDRELEEPRDGDEGGQGEHGDRPLPRQRQMTLQALLRRAHEGLGHPHRERFLKILQYSKANKEIMDAARKFECAACIRNQTVKPARRAAPPRELHTNELVGVDVVWLPTHDGKTRPALNIVDWHTHFQMMVVMPNKKPESVRHAYRHWARLFGPPTTLAVDLGREFQSCFSLRAESDGSVVEPSAVEAPYQRGITERAGKSFKLILAKTMETHHCESPQEWEELVDIVAFQRNRLLMQSGFSPIQRVIGFTPRIPGGLLTGDHHNLAHYEHIRLGDQGVSRSMAMRKAAAIAFHETECSQALRRAISAGPRPMQNYEIGETVYFWRVCHEEAVCGLLAWTSQGHYDQPTFDSLPGLPRNLDQGQSRTSSPSRPGRGHHPEWLDQRPGGDQGQVRERA